MQIEVNKNLQTLNTLAVPATCSHYYEAPTVAAVNEALLWAADNNQPVYVLGGGSNVIMTERIEGLVLRPKIMGIEHRIVGDGVLVTAGSGENWHEFVLHCVQSGWYGLENLALIPGDVGAAPIQNIGAYGVELKDFFHQLDAIDCRDRGVVSFDRDACKFAYRDSVFKRMPKGRHVITHVSFMLNKVMQPKATYPALNQWLVEHGVGTPSAADLMSAVIDIRQQKLPDPRVLPNAGSFFKNPVISLALYEAVKQKFSNVVAFDVGADQKKIPAAWLIEQAGWKGRTTGGVKVHSEHALVLTNEAGVGAREIHLAAELIRQDVYERFGIHLEVEPQFFGC